MYDEMKNCECVPEPSIDSLTDLMRETHVIADNAYGMAAKINVHMWGGSSAIPCNKENPSCFKEELLSTKFALLAATEELAKMCSMLGL